MAVKTTGNIYLVSATDNSALRNFCPVSHFSTTLNGYTEIEKYPVAMLPLSPKKISEYTISTIHNDNQLPTQQLKDISWKLNLYLAATLKGLIIMSNSIVVYKIVEKLMAAGKLKPAKVFLCHYHPGNKTTTPELTIAKPERGKSILPEHLHKEFELVNKLYNSK